MIHPLLRVLTIFTLLSCRSTSASDEGPPSIHMVVGGKRLSGEPGSSEWNGIAVDRHISVPETTGGVAQGEEIGFVQTGGTPQEAFLSVYRADDVGSPDITPVTEGAIDPRNLRWTVTVEPGEYVLTLSLTWEGEGDATIFFGLGVQESTGK